MQHKCTMSEWHKENKKHFQSADTYCHVADKILSESDKIRKETDDAANLCSSDVYWRLGERVKAIEYRKEELQKQKSECCIEEEALIVYKERLSNAIEALKDQPLKICQQCILIRESRIGVDLVSDSVDNELRKEDQAIVYSLTQLLEALDQTNEQIRLLRSSKYFIDQDNESKSVVLSIEKRCVHLRHTSPNISFCHGSAPLDSGIVTTEEWGEFSKKNIDRAVKEINKSLSLRSYVEMIMKQSTEALLKQYENTNKAFQCRIEDTKKAKTMLENQHYKALQKANEMVLNISNLEKTIEEREAFLALAQTRLGNRSQRPDIELTRDAVEISLLTEVERLREYITMLKDMVDENRAYLRHLHKTRLELEENINIKINSLKVDEVDCMTLRQSMSFHTY